MESSISGTPCNNCLTPLAKLADSVAEGYAIVMRDQDSMFHTRMALKENPRTESFQRKSLGIRKYVPTAEFPVRGIDTYVPSDIMHQECQGIIPRHVELLLPVICKAVPSCYILWTMNIKGIRSHHGLSRITPIDSMNDFKFGLTAHEKKVAFECLPATFLQYAHLFPQHFDALVAHNRYLEILWRPSGSEADIIELQRLITQAMVKFIDLYGPAFITINRYNSTSVKV